MAKRRGFESTRTQSKKRTNTSPFDFDFNPCDTDSLLNIAEEGSSRPFYDRHKNPSDFSCHGLPSFNKKSSVDCSTTCIIDNEEVPILTHEDNDKISLMEVTQPHNSTINNSHFNRRLSSNTNFNAIPNLGRSSLPQKDKEWITTRKTRQSSTHLDPLVDRSYLNNSHVNPYAKKAQGEQAMKHSLIKATNGRGQSICHSSSSDEDFEPTKSYRSRRKNTSQLKKSLQQPSLSFYKSSESKFCSDMTAPKLRKNICKTPPKAGSSVENPLCLDDEECMEEEQSNGEIYDKPESPTTTVQESPPPILQESSRYCLRSAPSRSIPHLSTSNEWDCIDLLQYVSEVWIGAMIAIPIQVEISSSGIWLSLEHNSCNDPIKIDLRYKDIHSIELSFATSPMVLLFHLKTMSYKREACKLESACKLKKFWPMKESYLLVKLNSKPDGITIDNMKKYFSDAHLEFKSIKSTAVEEIIRNRESNKDDTLFEFKTDEVSQDSDIFFETRPKTRSSLSTTTRTHRSSVKTSIPSPPIVIIPSFPADKVILTYKPKQINTVLSISGFDLKCLKDGEYLNDKIINFYLLYLWESLEDKGSHVHVFNSFFYSRLTNSKKDNKVDLNTPERTHVRVKSWTKNINIFDKRFTVVPVCYRCHWFLAIIICPEDYMNEEISETRLLKPSILVLDSMWVKRRQIGTELRKYLTQEYLQKYKSIKDFSKLPVSYPSAPGQTNTYDCGVYLLTYCESLFECIKTTDDHLPEGDQWAPEVKIQHKRQDILDLILYLAAKSPTDNVATTSTDDGNITTPIVTSVTDKRITEQVTDTQHTVDTDNTHITNADNITDTELIIDHEDNNDTESITDIEAGNIDGNSHANGVIAKHETDTELITDNSSHYTAATINPTTTTATDSNLTITEPPTDKVLEYFIDTTGNECVRDIITSSTDTHIIRISDNTSHT